MKKHIKTNVTEQQLPPGIDPGMIRHFLNMTPEERILSNDKTINAIQALRHAVEKSRKPSN